MKKKIFKIGDEVKIVNLKDPAGGGTFRGVIGHVGIITDIEKDVAQVYIDAGIGDFYVITPDVMGKCFPASCLEFAKPGRPSRTSRTKKSNTLFSMDDI